MRTVHNGSTGARGTPSGSSFVFFFLKKGSGVDHFDLLATGKTKTINSVDLIKLCHIWSNLSVRDVIEIEFVAFDMSAYIESTFKRTLVAEHET